MFIIVKLCMFLKHKIFVFVEEKISFEHLNSTPESSSLTEPSLNSKCQPRVRCVKCFSNSLAPPVPVPPNN